MTTRYTGDAPASPGEIAPPLMALRPATVLVVDDEDVTRSAMARSLGAAGFRVIEATSGADALARLGEQPAVVVLDVGLPDVDGIEVCRRIKEHPETANVPVLHFSADRTSSAARARGLAVGADAYLVHPFEPAELVALVKTLLRSRDHEQRRAEERIASALRESEDRLRAQFMAMPVPTYAWDLRGADFVLSGCNQAAIDITDGRIGWWIGTTASKMFPDDRYRTAMRECLATNRTVVMELSHRLVTTGVSKDFVVTFVPLRPDRVLVHTVDETDRRSAERSLRASEERYRALTEAGMDLVAVLSADGVYQYASPSYEATTGFSPRQLEGSVAMDLVHEDDAPAVARELQELVEHGVDIHRATARLRCADGSYRVIEFSGRNLLDHPAVRGLVFNGRDVTDREVAQRELRFRAQLLDTVEQAVIAVDMDGAVTYWNQFAERLYGWRADEVLGRSIVQFTKGGPSAGDPDALRKRLARRETWSGDFEGTTRDGRTFPGHLSETFITDRDGSPLGVVGISLDISERRALEHQLRQSQKLEAVGKLAGGIAHDFNNLLTVIRANAEFVRDILPHDVPAAGDIGEVLAAVDRAADLTRHLLAFSRKQMMSPVPLDLNDVMSGMQRMLQRLIGEDIELATDLDEHIGTVVADRGQLEQVVMNLAVNARDAMPEGGTLTISTTHLEPDALFRRRRDLPRGSYVVLSVRDTGTGIPENVIDQIFEPFFTTKEVGRGTGLGLSTAYGIVRQTGGYIFVESEVGVGTTFEVYLPCSAGFASSALVEAASSVGGSERVLLVEDEGAVRAATRRMLEVLGYEVWEAANGREALAFFEHAADQIDVVLTDVVMPGMNGRELIERLTASRPGLRVLCMSGYTDDEVVRRGLGPAGLLQKPFTTEALGAAIRRALAPSTATA